MYKHGKVYPGLLIPLICCVAALTACSLPAWQFLPATASTAVVSDPFACSAKVGVINDMNSIQGQELRNGYEMAKDEINASGGIAGCRLDLLFEDDRNDPETAGTAARKLIQNPEVVMLVGSFSSPCSLAVAKEAETAGVPFLIPNSTSSLLTRSEYVYSFRLPADSTSIVQSAFSFLKSQSRADSPFSASILYESNLSGSSLASAFLGMAADQGLSVLNYLKFRPVTDASGEDQYLSDLLTPVRDTLPDVLFITGDSEDTIVRILDTLRQKNIAPKAIIGLGGAFSNGDFLTQHAGSAEQVIIVNQWSPDIVWIDGTTDVRDRFLAEYADRFAQPPGNRSAQAYTAMYITRNVLNDAYTKNQNKLRQNARAALAAYDHDEPLFGHVRFDPSGQNQHSPILTQLIGGKSFVVFPDEYGTNRAEFPMHLASASGGETTNTGESIVKIGFQQTLGQFNPLWASLDIERSFFRQIYDTMYEIGSSGVYIPLLAQEATRSEDGKTFRFKIPADVKFHDGVRLTARDVAFSYRLYASTKDSVRANDLSGMESVRAEDDITLVMTFKEPVPDIADRLSQLYILPEHIWASIAADPAALRSYANVPPIGSGAFAYVSHTPGVEIGMKANKEHWKRPPRVDAMIWRLYSEQDRIIEDVEYGDLDAVSALSPAAANRIRNVPGIQVVSGTPLRPDFLDIIINQIDPRYCPAQAKCSGHPALRDLNVRRALAAATDKERIIRVSVSGMAIPGLTIVPSSLEKWPNTSLKDIPFDIDSANKILDDAGYLDLDGDGIRETPDGKSSLVFRLYYPAGNPKYLYERTAELLNESWTRIGVSLRISPVQESALVETVNPGFDHDIVLWSWSVNPNPDFILSIATTAQILGGNSESGYSNPAYDLLYLEQAAEQDPFKRLAAVWKLQEMLFNDVVYIIPYERQITCAVRTDRFRGWTLNAKKLMLELPGALSQLEVVR